MPSVRNKRREGGAGAAREGSLNKLVRKIQVKQAAWYDRYGLAACLVNVLALLTHCV